MSSPFSRVGRAAFPARRASAVFALLALGWGRAAQANAPPDLAPIADVEDAALRATEAPAEPPARPRYSLPWQLRPAGSANLLRVDSTASIFNDPNGNLDEAVVTMLSARYQLTKEWAPLLRLGFVGNDAPGAAADGSSFANALLGASRTRLFESSDVSFFGAVVIPVGTGGGNAPSLGAARTNAASATARPADAAMFAVNEATAMSGATASYLSHGFTAQGEATLQQSCRVRGDKSPSSPDAFRTRGSLGVHLGYFLGSHLSLGGDLLYQRWLSHPTTVSRLTGARVPLSRAERDTVTLAVGFRLHVRLGQRMALHPGLSFVRGLDGRGSYATLLTAATTGVELDMPLTF